MKKILLIVAFLLILIAIPVTAFLVRQRQELRERAAPATIAYFEPTGTSTSPINVAVGDTFTLNVVADTASNSITASELTVNFNTQYLEALNIQSGDLLPFVFVSGEVDNQTGAASITVGTTQMPGGIQGTGNIAVITFRALAETSTPTTIQINSSTQIVAVGEGNVNVLTGTEPAYVMVTAGGSPSPTPAVSPSPGISPSPGGASPSPQPSVTPGTGGPSPSPAVSPSPSASPQVTRIITPANGSTVTTSQPVISGETFPGALVIIQLNDPNSFSTTLTADVNGDWSYTPTTNFPDGTWTITVVAEDAPTRNQETAQNTFTINTSGATPAPSTTPGTGGGASVSPDEIPVTGTSTPTLYILAIAALLLFFGAGALLLN